MMLSLHGAPAWGSATATAASQRQASSVVSALDCSADGASTSSRCSAPGWAAPARSNRRHRRCNALNHEFSLWREEVPIPKGYVPSVVPGVRTTATQLLSPDKVRPADGALTCAAHIAGELLAWAAAAGETAGVPRNSPSGASALQVVERLRNAVHPTAKEHFGAFYSSELGGIVTDPSLMLIHVRF